MKKVAVILATGLMLSACAQEAAEPQAAQTEPPALEAVTLPQADGAGNRLEALSQSEDRWFTADGAWLLVVDHSIAVTHGGRSIVLPGENVGDELSFWPHIVRMSGANERALVGVVRTNRQMYSGGGGTASWLTLFEVSDGGAREVLTLPVSGNIDIRACFDEEDQQQRADACSDQYSFVSRVRLDETVTSGGPHIILETAAGTYPGRVTRGEDSLERPALTQADLVWAHDDVCSFRRTFSRNSTGVYVPDAELPACTDYLEP